jgi:hypothetical protein
MNTHSQAYRESLANWAAGLSQEQIASILMRTDLSDAEFDAVFFEDVRRTAAKATS